MRIELVDQAIEEQIINQSHPSIQPSTASRKRIDGRNAAMIQQPRCPKYLWGFAGWVVGSGGGSGGGTSLTNRRRRCHNRFGRLGGRCGASVFAVAAIQAWCVRCHTSVVLSVHVVQ